MGADEAGCSNSLLPTRLYDTRIYLAPLQMLYSYLYCTESNGPSGGQIMLIVIMRYSYCSIFKYGPSGGIVIFDTQDSNRKSHEIGESPPTHLKAQSATVLVLYSYRNRLRSTSTRTRTMSTERICGTVAPVPYGRGCIICASYDRTKRSATVQEDGHTDNGMYD